MKALKKSIELELIICFLMLLCCCSPLWGQNKAQITPDSFQQHLIRQVRPYLNSVTWVKDLLKVDTVMSDRTLRLGLLPHFDENWLKTARCSKEVPDEWISSWSPLGIELSFDIFPHHYLRKLKICHVLGFMHRDSTALMWALENGDTTVLALTKVGVHSHPEAVFLNVQPLIKRYYYEPETQTFTQLDVNEGKSVPNHLLGEYKEHSKYENQQDKFTAMLNDSMIYAMNRWWKIQYKGEIQANHRRAYRIWAKELKTRRPGYFLIKEFGYGGRKWALSLTIESSPSREWQDYYQLGEKQFINYERRLKQVENTSKTFLFSFLFTAMAALAFYFITRNQRRQQRQTQMSLASLRAQLNPHFLFNTLTSIQDLMNQDNKPAANRYFNEMAQLLRYVVDSSAEEYTSLASELAALEKYCSLEALRTPFSYEFDLHPDLDLHNLEIPTMLLQPFVENAILHGLRPSHGSKHLKISLWPESGERLGISIIDDGIGIEESKSRQLSVQTKRSHQGINTTEKRIDLINQGKKHKIMLKIEDRSQLKPNQTGTQVQLSIPV